MRIFFDNPFPPVLSEFLQGLSRFENDGHTFSCVYEMYEGEDPHDDTIWINRLKRENKKSGKSDKWIVCTKDIGSRDKQIIPAIEEAGLTAFFFINRWNHIDTYEIAWRTLKALPEIFRLASERPEGQVFFVPFKGQIRR